MGRLRDNAYLRVVSTQPLDRLEPMFRKRGSRPTKPPRKFLTKPSPWQAIAIGSLAIMFTLSMAAAVVPMFEPLEYAPTPTWPVLPPSHPKATPTHYPMMPPTAEPPDAVNG